MHATCLLNCNGQLLRPVGISPLHFFSIRFIVELCLLIRPQLEFCELILMTPAEGGLFKFKINTHL